MKIKAALIFIAFIICLALVVVARQAASGTFSVHKVDFYENNDDWSSFELNNLVTSKDKNRLMLISLDKPGHLISPLVKTDFDFDEILLSWNCGIDKSGGLFFVISVSPDSENWYDFNYQQWGNNRFDTPEFSSLPTSIEDIGWLDKDIIRLYQPMRFYRFSLTCFNDSLKQFSLDRVVVCYSNTNTNMRQYYVNKPPEKQIEKVVLAVPYKSQHASPDSISGSICSPTSVAMVLNYYNHNFSQLEVAELAYDSINDIYGNWSYNTQAAYCLGMKKTWVGRHSSFNELVPELLDGRPVVISIAVRDYQQLSGAPYSKTEGHLIVVRGFNGENRVWVDDPAGHDVSDGVIAYDIDELTEVWTGHQGVAYHIWPE